MIPDSQRPSLVQVLSMAIVFIPTVAAIFLGHWVAFSFPPNRALMSAVIVFWSQLVVVFVCVLLVWNGRTRSGWLSLPELIGWGLDWTLLAYAGIIVYMQRNLGMLIVGCGLESIAVLVPIYIQQWRERRASASDPARGEDHDL